MKYSCVLIALFVCVSASADPLLTPRPLDAWAAETFDRARGRSVLVRELVRRIEVSNLVVHIETSAAMPMGVGGTMRFVTRAGDYRYARITLARDLQPNQRAAVLGHELQHACELAESTASDQASVRHLFESVGHKVANGEIFETHAAVLAGQRVWAELRTGKAEVGRETHK